MIGLFLEVVLYLVPVEQLLQVVLVALPVLEVIVAVEIELLVLRLVLAEGAPLHLLQVLRLVLQPLDYVVLLLHQHVKLLQLLVHRQQVCTQDRHLADSVLQIHLHVLVGVGRTVVQLLQNLAELTVLLLPAAEVVVDLLLLLGPRQLLHESHLCLLRLQIGSLLLVAALLEVLQLEVAGLDGGALLLDLGAELLDAPVAFADLARLHLQLLDLLLHDDQLLLPLGLLALADVDVLLHSLHGDLELPAQLGELVLLGLELLLEEVAAAEVGLVVVDRDVQFPRPPDLLLQASQHPPPLALDALDLLYYLQQVLPAHRAFFFYDREKSVSGREGRARGEPSRRGLFMYINIISQLFIATNSCFNSNANLRILPNRYKRAFNETIHPSQTQTSSNQFFLSYRREYDIKCGHMEGADWCYSHMKEKRQ